MSSAPAQANPAARARSLRAGGAPRGSLQSLLRLVAYLRPHWKLTVGCYAAWLVTVGLDSIIPLMVLRAVDQGIGGRNTTVLATSVLAMVGLYLLKAAFNYAFFSLYHYYEAAAARDLRRDIYGALQRLSFSYFDRVETGQLISRSTSDVESAQMFLGHALSMLLSVIGTWAVTLAVAFALNWQLSLLSLLTLPVLIGVALYFGKEVRPLFAQVQQQHGVMTGTLQENIAGIRVVKAFAREGYETGKFEAAARDLLRRNITLAKLVALRLPLMSIISGLGSIIVIWYGGWLAISGALSIGTLIAFNYYLARLMGPTQRIGWIINMVARAFASADRIFEIVDTNPDVQERPGAVALRDVRGEIRFESVWFEFEPGRPVLRGLDLTIAPGEVVGVIGATGSGKSALAGLIPRFYDVSAGRVSLDGVDVRSATLESLRRSIAIVQQDPFLFSRSLRENIAFGRPEAEREHVEHAAEHAQVHHFATLLPDGYETLVGDRGLSLSGGQRQRTTLARAVLVEPKVLILDDAVSSVDVETERRIQEALRRVWRGRTVLIVAHRVSTVQSADRIIVLEDGAIAEQGSHEELLRLGGRYATLYRAQQQPS